MDERDGPLEAPRDLGGRAGRADQLVAPAGQSLQRRFDLRGGTGQEAQAIGDHEERHRHRPDCATGLGDRGRDRDQRGTMLARHLGQLPPPATATTWAPAAKAASVARQRLLGVPRARHGEDEARVARRRPGARRS